MNYFCVNTKLALDSYTATIGGVESRTTDNNAVIVRTRCIIIDINDEFLRDHLRCNRAIFDLASLMHFKCNSAIALTRSI